MGFCDYCLSRDVCPEANSKIYCPDFICAECSTLCGADTSRDFPYSKACARCPCGALTPLMLLGEKVDETGQLLLEFT